MGAFDCEFGEDEVAWEKFAHFHKLLPVAFKSRDTCMAVSSYMATIADFTGNQNFKVGRCEHTRACLAALYEEDMTEEDEVKNMKKCVKGITTSSSRPLRVGYGRFRSCIAEAFPTLEGSPLPYE